jgi:hypothetical protein
VHSFDMRRGRLRDVSSGSGAMLEMVVQVGKVCPSPRTKVTTSVNRLAGYHTPNSASRFLHRRRGPALGRKRVIPAERQNETVAPTAVIAEEMI